MAAGAANGHGSKRRRGRLLAGVLFAALLLWAGLAYLAVPWIWDLYFRDHPDLEGGPRLTHTSDDHPGDPINIAVVGSQEDLLRAMHAIGWHPADPLTFESSLRIALDTLIDRPDEDAPVSSLYLFGRRQDLAFERPVGESPRRRHHVRFWRDDAPDGVGAPTWFGSATYDASVGLSHTTGEITHHIAPDIDAERDRIIDALTNARRTQDLRWIDDYHAQREGRNGGGDRWETDGRLAIVSLAAPQPP